MRVPSAADKSLETIVAFLSRFARVILIFKKSKKVLTSQNEHSGFFAGHPPLRNSRQQLRPCRIQPHTPTLPQFALPSSSLFRGVEEIMYVA